jgi:hypothetical protein
LLVIQLKRFFTKGPHQRKLDLNVEYPSELEMTPFVRAENGGANYRLVAVIEHSGGPDGGHYIADALYGQLMKWYQFRDDIVKAIKQSDAHSANAYIGCPTSGVAQGSLTESGALLTRRPQEKTSVRTLDAGRTLILIQAPCGAAFIRGNHVEP